MRIESKLILAVLACGCPAAQAQQPAPQTQDPEARARALVEDVLADSSADAGRALERDLAEWARAIVEDAGAAAWSRRRGWRVCRCLEPGRIGPREG